MDARTAWTAVYVATESGIVGYIEEMPGAHAQGATIEETEPRLREALSLMLAANRRTTWEDFKGARVVKRERLSFERIAVPVPHCPAMSRNLLQLRLKR